MIHSMTRLKLDSCIEHCAARNSRSLCIYYASRFHWAQALLQSARQIHHALSCMAGMLRCAPIPPIIDSIFCLFKQEDSFVAVAAIWTLLLQQAHQLIISLQLQYGFTLLGAGWVGVLLWCVWVDGGRFVVRFVAFFVLLFPAQVSQVPTLLQALVQGGSSSMDRSSKWCRSCNRIGNWSSGGNRSYSRCCCLDWVCMSPPSLIHVYESSIL